MGLAINSPKPDDRRDRLGPDLPDAALSGQALPRDAGLLLRPDAVRQAPGTYAALGSTDLIVTAGGGIMAHPAGVQAGVAAMRHAWDAAVAGIALTDYAREHPELEHALDAAA